jgi:autotransporter-associated beta strand protein
MRVPNPVARWLVAVVVLAAAAAPAPAQITWNFIYNDTTAGFADPTPTQGGTSTLGADRRATVGLVAAYLNTQLDARGTINITFNTSQTGGTGSLASAGASISATNGFQNGLPFRRATTGTAPGSTDGSATFDFGYDWNVLLNTPTGSQTDLFSVTLHELTHTLGHTPRMQQSGQGSGSQPLGSPDRYGQFARYFELGSGPSAPRVVLDNAAFNTAEVSASVTTSNNLFFDGPIARAANGGNPVRVYAPTTFAPGSSLSHVNQVQNGVSTQAVMQFSIPDGTTRRQFLNFEIGVLIDMGWNQYFWTNTSGNWGDHTTSANGSPWQNFEQANSAGVYSGGSLSPVGTITPNVLLTFRGSGSTAYTSTNNLALNNTGGRFLLMRMILDGSSTGTNTIRADGAQVLRFGTSIGVQPQIVQRNSGAFVISHPVELTSANLELTGTGTGVVTISGPVGVQSGQTGGITKTGAATFVLSGANTYNGPTAVNGGVLRVANTTGSATGTGAVGVNAGGTLGGATGQPAGAAGKVSGNVTVADGGFVRPGNAAVTQAGQVNFTGAAQTVTFQTGSRYAWSLVSETAAAGQAGIGYDQLLVANGSGLSLTGGRVELLFAPGLTPSETVPFWQAAHQWTILDVTGGTNATQFAGIVNAEFGLTGSFFLSAGPDGDVFLSFDPTPVPEPVGVLVLAAAGLALLARRPRRGRS